MKMKKLFLPFLVVLIFALGCKNDDAGTNTAAETPELTEIIVSSPVTNIILEVQGNTVQLSFTALDQDTKGLWRRTSYFTY